MTDGFVPLLFVQVRRELIAVRGSPLTCQLLADRREPALQQGLSLHEGDDFDAVARRQEHHLCQLFAPREPGQDGRQGVGSRHEALADLQRRRTVREADDDDHARTAPMRLRTR